jgi:dephospho-CoA kinase
MLIGITGTNGSGKGAVVDYLVSKKDFSHYSAKAIIHEELERRHLPHTRDTMRAVANDLRREHGPAYLIECLYGQASQDGNAVMESVRTIGEAEFLKAKGAFILAIDADKKLRYERIVLRNDQKDIGLTFEQFAAHEEQEMASSDPWDMNVFGVMQLADASIENDSSIEELHVRIDEALAKFV